MGRRAGPRGSHGCGGRGQESGLRTGDEVSRACPQDSEHGWGSAPLSGVVLGHRRGQSETAGAAGGDSAAWQDDVLAGLTPSSLGTRGQVRTTGPQGPLGSPVGPALRWGPDGPRRADAARRSARLARSVHVSHPSWAQIALNHRVPSRSFCQPSGACEQPHRSSALESGAHTASRGPPSRDPSCLQAQTLASPEPPPAHAPTMSLHI